MSNHIPAYRSGLEMKRITGWIFIMNSKTCIMSKDIVVKIPFSLSKNSSATPLRVFVFYEFDFYVCQTCK